MEVAGISCWASRFESWASHQESASLTSLGRSNTDRSQGGYSLGASGVTAGDSFLCATGRAFRSIAAHADSPVLQSYPLTESPDVADLTALLILGQNMSPWSLGPRSTEARGSAAESHSWPGESWALTIADTSAPPFTAPALRPTTRCPGSPSTRCWHSRTAGSGSPRGSGKTSHPSGDDPGTGKWRC